MNIKKIGMTALAASLVSTSVFAGELTASGGASMAVEGYSGSTLQSDTAYSMGDSVTLSGTTELDNGMTVTMAFELDGDNEDSDGTSSYDDNSITISSDAMGKVKFSAHGGSSATSAIDKTAAGDVFDTFDGSSNGLTVTGVAVDSAGAGGNSFFYTLPSMVDGLALTASLNTSGTTGNNATAFAGTYSGVDGLSVSYGIGNIESGLAATDGDQTVMKASYAYGPVTLSYSNNDSDVGTANNDQETTSYAVSYTVSEAISVTYGTETIDSANSTEVDAEYEGMTVAYTAGGMTITAKSQDAQNIDHSTNANADYDYWSLGLSFAF